MTSTNWSFGDGASAEGRTVNHTYAGAGAGDRTATVTATDAVGNATSASAPVSVAAAPPSAVPPPAPNALPPGLSITEFALTRSTFAVAAKARNAAKKPARGTTFRLTLSGAAGATISISREIPGLRRGRRCVRTSAALRRSILRSNGTNGLRRARCVRLVKAGSLKRSARAGRNSFPFSGRIGGRALKPTRYRASVVASDATGNRASRSGVRFRVVRAR